MSSPITSRKKGRLDAALISLHQRLSHGRRIGIIARRVADLISAHAAGTGRELRCLDVGCGDMQLAERVAVLLPNTVWTCVDIHPLPDELRGSERWRKYQPFDGTHLPFPDGQFDIVLFSDVLHHVQTNAAALLAEAGRTGRAVIIKDHFERSIWSRAMLWAMDFLGNWGYGVALPRRYFTLERLEALAKDAGLRVTLMQGGIDLYGHLPFGRLLLRPEWQFIGVLEPLDPRTGAAPGTT